MTRYISEAINFEVIRWFALRAKAAYDQEAQIKAIFPDTTRVSIVPGTDVQYFLEFDSKAGEQIISIRGTDNLQNFKQDAEYIPSKNKQLHIYVHSGFDADTYKVYLDILPFLRKELRVKLTGHSLGAAISTLLMIYLHADGFDIARSINFGQPKLTNKEGVNRYEFLPLTRVVDENDVVPLLPPVTLLDSLHGLYEHLGDEIILLEGPYYAYLEQHDAERKSVWSFWENIGEESVSEHYMANYIKNLDSKLADALPVPYAQRETYINKQAE